MKHFLSIILLCVVAQLAAQRPQPATGESVGGVFKMTQVYKSTSGVTISTVCKYYGKGDIIMQETAIQSSGFYSFEMVNKATNEVLATKSTDPSSPNYGNNWFGSTASVTATVRAAGLAWLQSTLTSSGGGAATLPSGAATEAKQDVQIASLTAIDGKMTADPTTASKQDELKQLTTDYLIDDAGALLGAGKAVLTGASYNGGGFGYNQIAANDEAPIDNTTLLHTPVGGYDVGEGLFKIIPIKGKNVSVKDSDANDKLDAIDSRLVDIQAKSLNIADNTNATNLALANKATAALQTTNNTLLAGLDAKFSSLGQKVGSVSVSVVPASNYTEYIKKEWKVVTPTGLPISNVGDILVQCLRNNGGTVQRTWFNMTQSSLFINEPSVPNLTENTNKGGDLLNGQNGRQEWSMYTNAGVSGFGNNSIYAGGQFITSIGNAVTTSQSTFTVPAGKTLRIISIGFNCVTGQITTGYQVGNGVSVVYNAGAVPTTNSPQAITAQGTSGYIPQNSGTNNGLYIGGTNSHSGCDIPSGSVVGVYNLFSNINLQTFTIHVKGYLYNN